MKARFFLWDTENPEFPYVLDTVQEIREILEEDFNLPSSVSKELLEDSTQEIKIKIEEIQQAMTDAHDELQDLLDRIEDLEDAI